MKQRKLILVRHAKPHIVPDVPAREWGLSEKGRALCREIAKQISPYAPGRIVTSTETKAVQTGQLIADSLNVIQNIHPVGLARLGHHIAHKYFNRPRGGNFLGNCFCLGSIWGDRRRCWSSGFSSSLVWKGDCKTVSRDCIRRQCAA